MNTKGLKAYKIPFARADGEVYYVLVAVGDTEGVFADKIHIAKSYVLFDWKTWSELD